jgi:hypothetical protein
MKTPFQSTFCNRSFRFPFCLTVIASNLAAAGLATAAVPVRLTLNPHQDTTPAWDPRGETIVYMRTASPSGSNVPYNLYQVQAGTPGESVFATGPTDGYGLANNPGWIGSSGFLGLEERCVYHEYMKFDASKAPFTRTAYDGSDAAFTRLLTVSGGGGRMVFSRDGLTAMWRHSTNGGSGTQQVRTGPVAALTGQNATTVGTLLIQTYHATEQRMMSGMALSPDGSVAILSLPWDGPDATNTHARDLWLYRLDGSAAPVNLTQEGSGGVYSDFPDFLPGGDRIVYARTSGVAGETWDLYVMKIEGAERRQLTDTLKFAEYTPSVSGDGGRVAFTGAHIAGFENTAPALPAGEVANANIYVMPFEDPFLVPEIDVEHDGSLVDGQAVVDYGSYMVGSTPANKTFTIKNEGNAVLTGIWVSIVDSAGAEYFMIGETGASSLFPHQSTTFTVAFNPRVAGHWTAAIMVYSNDADEGEFNITLWGNATEAVPEISVEQPKGSSLVDGKTKKSFGSVRVGKAGIAKVFTIRNQGSANLKGLAITKSGKNAKDFVVTAPAKTTLSAGSTTTFKVTFKPTAKGTRNASIRIKSNDADENPFDIKLTGLGLVH